MVNNMQEQLNNLFKPYVLRFQTLEDLKGNNKRLDKFVDNIMDVDTIKASQCSKSADRTCANAKCRYNLLKHNYFDGGVNDEC